MYKKFIDVIAITTVLYFEYHNVELSTPISQAIEAKQFYCIFETKFAQ